MTVLEQSRPAGPSPLAAGRPRILGGDGDPSLAAHLHRHGPLPLGYLSRLTEEVLRAGLRGRGGAGFPTAIKMDAVRRAARRSPRRTSTPVVVANATEGEPASAKDKVLVRVAPHLVIDGMVAAAVAVGADYAVLCIERRDTATAAAAQRALAERHRHDPVAVTVALTPARYVAGEETALVNWLNGGDARPTFAPPRPSDRGVDGRPTLVDNAETLANVALIARHGAAAYRQSGEPDEPGHILVTARGALARPGIHELPIGAPLGPLLGPEPTGAVLVGGYFGTWLTPEQARRAELSNRALRPLGASLGCGLVAALPVGHCPLQEVDAVLAWLAANSAGQCGACVNGLPALSRAFGELAAGDRTGSAAARLDRWTPMVAGRGACKLPDGAVRFLDSARVAFAEHIELHRRYGPCPPNPSAVLPTPALEGWR